MSRRARAVEVWAALRSLGRRGLAEMIERNCRHAARFADRAARGGIPGPERRRAEPGAGFVRRAGAHAARHRRDSAGRHVLVRRHFVAGNHCDAHQRFVVGDDRCGRRTEHRSHPALCARSAARRNGASMIVETLTIDRRFRGPAQSGNGGYVCGRIARHVPGHCDGPACDSAAARDAAARRCDRRCRAAACQERRWSAKAAPHSWTSTRPAPVSFEAATRKLEALSRLRASHVSEVLRLRPAAAAGRWPANLRRRGAQGATWSLRRGSSTSRSARRSRRSFCGRRSTVRAASRCGRRAKARRSCSVSSRLRFAAQVMPGDKCVAMGWPLQVEGRKRFAGSAVYSADGQAHRAGARHLDRSAGERVPGGSHTFCSFHFPRLKSTALHSASTENEIGTAMKTPSAPSPAMSARIHASGTWPSQKQKKFRRVGVQVSPAPLNADSEAHAGRVERKRQAHDPQARARRRRASPDRS